MRFRKFLLPSTLFFLSLAFAATALAQATSRKYYVDGKQIPTPAQLPPEYPDKEFRRRIGGTTIVAYTHDAQGKVTSARVKESSGNKNLDKAAVAAVLKWKVTPTRSDGAPAPGEDEAPITFTP